jgi:hypothetical protein
MVFGELRRLGAGGGRGLFQMPSGRCLGAEGALLTRQCPTDNSNRAHEQIQFLSVTT